MFKKVNDFIPSGSILTYEDNVLTSINKKEKIIISISEIINYTPFEDWSSAKIEISRTEKELVHKLFYNWHEYFDGDFYSIKKEYNTEHGPIDLLGITEDGVYHVIEVKRKKGTISGGTQLKRYVDVLRDQGLKVHGYLACPEIGDNALKY